MSDNLKWILFFLFGAVIVATLNHPPQFKASPLEGTKSVTQVRGRVVTRHITPTVQSIPKPLKTVITHVTPSPVKTQAPEKVTPVVPVHYQLQHNHASPDVIIYSKRYGVQAWATVRCSLANGGTWQKTVHWGTVESSIDIDAPANQDGCIIVGTNDPTTGLSFG